MVSIIEKESTLKTQRDIKMLQGALKNIKLFQELANEIPPQQMLNLFRELNHVTCPTRTVVFNQGEIGKEFYIILKGVVFIIGSEDKKGGQTDQNDKKDNNEEESAQQQQQQQQQNIQQPQKSPQQPKPHQLLRKASMYQKTTVNTTSPLVTQKTQSNIKQMQITQNKKPSGTEMQPIQEDQSQPVAPVTNNKLRRSPSLASSFLSLQKYSVFEETDEDYIKKTFPHFDILAKLESGSSFGEVALKDSVPRTATVVCSGETHFVTLKRDAFKKFLEGYYELVQQQNIFFVKEISIFKNWSDQMVNQMFFFFEKRTVRMNQLIYRENQEPDGIYLIKTGDVKLYQGFALAYNQEDKLKSIRRFMRAADAPKIGSFQAPISHLSAGQLFGQDEIVFPSLRKHTAVCCSSTSSLLFLNKDKFLQFSKRRNTFENAMEESAVKEKWHSLILSQLTSFQKGQHEYYKKQEREQKKASFSLQRQQQQKTENTLNNSISIPQYQSAGNISMKYIPDALLFPSTEKAIRDWDTPCTNNINFQHSSTNLPQMTTGEKNNKFNRMTNQQLEVGLVPSSSLRSIPEIKRIGMTVKSEQIIPYGTTAQHNTSKMLFYHPQQQQPPNDEGVELDMSFSKNLPQQQNSKGNQPRVSEDVLQLNEASQPQCKSQSLIPEQPQQYYFSYNNVGNSQKYPGCFNIPKTAQILPSMSSKLNLRTDTIRNCSVDDGRVAKEMENRLHASLQMHKTFQNMSEANFQESLNASCVHKLDLDNQMIRVCESNPAFKKRIENLSTKMGSYEGKQGAQQRNIAAFPLDKKGIQKRILKTLKLPRLLDTDSHSLLSIFTQKDKVNNAPVTSNNISEKQNKTGFQLLSQSSNSTCMNTTSNNKASASNIMVGNDTKQNINEDSIFITTDAGTTSIATESTNEAQIVRNISCLNLNKRNQKSKTCTVLPIQELPGHEVLLSPIEQVLNESLFGSMQTKKQMDVHQTSVNEKVIQDKQQLRLNSSGLLEQKQPREKILNRIRNSDILVSSKDPFSIDNPNKKKSNYLSQHNSQNNSTTKPTFQLFNFPLVYEEQEQQQKQQP